MSVIFAKPEFNHLPDISAYCIDSFLDKRTLEYASECGSVQLLNILYEREWSGMSREFRIKRMKHSIGRAVRDGNIDVLNWWLTRYCPDGYDEDNLNIMVQAIECGQVSVLQWLEKKNRIYYGIAEGMTSTKVLCSSFACAVWVHKHEPKGITMKLDLSKKSIKDHKSYFDFVQWALTRQDTYPLLHVNDSINWAVACGLLKELQWLCTRGLHVSQRALPIAIGCGHVDIADWLTEIYPAWTCYNSSLFTGAVCSLETVQWLAEKCVCPDRVRWFEVYLSNAVFHSDITLIEHLYSVYPDIPGKWAMDRAASEGKLAILQILHRLGAQSTVEGMDSAAAKGHLDVVKWLHQNRNEGCTTEAMDLAAMFGHLDVVKWLHHNRKEGCSSNAVYFAASNGHLEVVKWMHHNRKEGCDSVMVHAAWDGHLEVVKWLHWNRRQTCTRSAMCRAAGDGRLDVVKWMHENLSAGILGIWKFWNRRTLESAMQYAAQNYQLEVVQYLFEHVSEACRMLTLKLLATSSDLDVIKWVCEQGQMVDPTAVQDVNTHWPVVRFLVFDCKVKFDEKLLDIVYDEPHFGRLESLVKFAQTAGHLDIQSRFIKNTPPSIL